jgi:phospholipase/carboxylesterase
MISTRTFESRYLPARVPGGREHLLVVLHGLGDSLNGWHFLPEALRIPELSCLLINAPDPYYGGYSWYDFLENPAPGIRKSRALLADLLEELEDQGVRPADTLLFGFSQGCLMAVDAGLRTDMVLVGIVGVSGYVAFPEEYPAAFGKAALSQKFLVTHGRNDPVIPYDPSRKQFHALRKLGIDVDFVTYAKDHTVLQEEMDDAAAWVRSRLP